MLVEVPPVLSGHPCGLVSSVPAGIHLECGGCEAHLERGPPPRWQWLGEVLSLRTEIQTPGHV